MTIVLRCPPSIWQPLTLLSLALLTAIATAQCARNSTNKDSFPTFFCKINVTVTHVAGCQVQVSETYVLPHSDGKDFNRMMSLYRFGGAQKLSEIRSSFNGSDVLLRLDTEGIQQINISTIKSSAPVTIKLSYVLDNGAFQVKKGCITCIQEKADLLRWEFTTFELDVESLQVTFASGENIVKLFSFNIDLEDNRSSTITAIGQSLPNGVEVFAQLDSNKCRRLWKCFQMSGFVIVSVIIGLGPGLLAIGCCIFILVIVRCRMGTESQVQESAG